MSKIPLGPIIDFNNFKDYYDRFSLESEDKLCELHILESDLKLPYFEQKLIEFRQFVLSRGIKNIAFHSVDRIIQSVLYEEEGHEKDLEKFNLLIKYLKQFSNEIKQEVLLVVHFGAKYENISSMSLEEMKAKRAALLDKAGTSFKKLQEQVADSYLSIALENSPPSCASKPMDHVVDICFEDFKERLGEEGKFVLDLSHAAMAIEYFNQNNVKFPALEVLRDEHGKPPFSLQSLENYVQLAGKNVVWLHVNDANGILGENEGKVVGCERGLVPFNKIIKSIQKYVKEPKGILEICNAHQDFNLLSESLKNFKKFQQTRIKNNLISKERCYIVAEIASSHCGSKEKLKTIFRESVLADADGVKFQMFDAPALCSTQHPGLSDLQNIALSKSEWIEVLEYAKKFDTTIFAEVFDEGSADLAEPYADAYSIHASDISNPFLLKHVAKKGKPMLLYIGGSTLDEMRSAVETVSEFGNDIIIVYGLQNFPTSIENVNLNRIKALEKEFGLPVCYHDHTNAEEPLAKDIAIHAFAFGAVMVEKHVTDDRSLKGFDYVSSLNPHELKEVVKRVRTFEKVLGKPEFSLKEADYEYRNKMKKFIVASNDIPSGKVITKEDLAFKRVKNGEFHPIEIEKILGRKTKNAILKDHPVKNKDIARKAVILVPARMKSKRLPRKALLDLSGDTTLGQQLERLRKSKHAEVIFCTSTLDEDKVLLEEAQKRGVKAYAGHPDDVIDRFLMVADNENAELLVRATGDNPVMDPELIDRMIEYHLNNNADYTTVEDVPIGFNAEVFSVSVLKKARTLVKNPLDTEYMTWFLKDPKHFNVHVMPVRDEEKADFRLTLDTPEDLEVIRKLYEGIHSPDKVFSCAEAVAFLKENPHIASINLGYTQQRLPPKLQEIKVDE